MKQMQCNALNIKITAKQVWSVLYSQNYAARICGHYHESSSFESDHTKTYFPNSPTHKNPGI